MKINATTKLFGLLGNPVEHSLSPLLQNSLAEKMGHNMAYLAFPVGAGAIGEAVRGASALGVAGLNVTVPYKTAVIPYLSAIDPAAERLGAVNTLVRRADGFHGYNTDTLGLYVVMASEDMNIEDREIILLGAGGAARAAAYMCAEKKARQVFIINRTHEKAEELASEVNRTMQTEIFSAIALDDLAQLPPRKYLAIQSTSLGMHPFEDDVLIEDTAFYEKIEAAIDLVYNPSETLFMKKVQAAGGRAVNGLKMLLYQGVAAYELWQQVSVPKEIIGAAYDELKGIFID
jgi:shikimate dehydrogenase